MAYNTDLPPTIARTAQTAYELRTASGSVIATYDQAAMEHPTGWWPEIITYVVNTVSGSDKAIQAITDLTLLMIQSDWTIVDER
jgi:hypothetical protein